MSLQNPSGGARVRNPIGWRDRLAHLRGSPVQLDLSAYSQGLDEINRLGTALSALSDEALAAHVEDLRLRAGSGLEREAIRRPLFALVRELARRRVGLRPFDEQIVAALALDDGAVVEMQTGEGKTLAAVMPVALAALCGRGVARPDLQRLPGAPRRRVDGADLRRARAVGRVRPAGHDARGAPSRVRADVTYVTAKEAGFDHLRDLLATRSPRARAPPVSFRARWTRPIRC